MWVGCSESGTADARQGRGGADEGDGGEALPVCELKLELDMLVPSFAISSQCYCVCGRLHTATRWCFAATWSE